MTGTKPVQVSRGRYVSAGYAEKQERRAKDEKKLYIAADPAGSARENLRDLNRTGYRSERPWRETPSPALQEPEEKKRTAAAARPAAKKRQLGPIDRLLLEIRRDRKGVTICALLAATMLVMAAAWGRNMVAGVNTQRMIERYQAQTITLQQENEKLTQQLEIAKNGERIRNLAQNELGMLRRERAQTETIYIQAPEKKTQEGAQTAGETHMEILDFLLGLLNVFHIGE